VISSIPVLRAELHVSAMYRRNFKSQIFTDITTPVKQSYSPYTGKKAQLLSHTKFESDGMISQLCRMLRYSQCITVIVKSEITNEYLSYIRNLIIFCITEIGILNKIISNFNQTPSLVISRISECFKLL